MANLSYRRISPLSVLVNALILSHGQLASGALNCFGPKGDQILNAVPCHPDAEVSFCCAPGDICLSNGLCAPGPDVTNHGFVDTYRPAGCTDGTWNSTECFSGCNSFDGNGLAACGSGEYCCYDMNGCVCSETSLFNLGAATFETTLPLSTMAPTSTPASTPATTTADTTPTADPSASKPGLSSSASSATQAASESKDNSVAIGAGVGVGLGVPLIAVSGFLAFFLLRRKKQAQQQYPDYTATKHAELGVNEPRHEAPGGYYSVPSGSPGVPYTSERYAHESTNGPPQEMEAPAKKP